ncbi:MAG: dTDP-glucose 4,6-dehydratase [bacterium]|nr:dTDP-glucose 4,6-dehydratase [bacterium]
MKILITGGLGFIGSNMIHYLLKKYPDYRICNLDKMTYAGNPANLADIANDARYSFVQGDIADEAVVEKVFIEFKPDCVISYAAETHVDRSIMDPKAFLQTAVIGTFTLLEAVRKHKTARYVQISTDEVFGSITEGEFREDSPMLPNSPYSAAKAGEDLLCRSYVETYHLPIIVTHSCNVYGPYHYPEKVIPLFVTNLLEGKKVPLYGDGKNVREWIYTEDHCSAVDYIAHHGVLGEVYNIGSGDRITNSELTHAILERVGAGEDMIEFVRDRAGHDLRYAIDSSKLRSLGWAPQVSFTDGLQKTVDWYKSHEDWWKSIKSGSFAEYYQKQYSAR